MNPLKGLREHGQSFWIDFISRNWIVSGELRRLIDEDGLSGLTSNPSIFQKSISGSKDYAENISRFLKQSPNANEHELYEHIAVEDIQMAADVLRSVYDKTNRADGYVSLEVSPHLAYDTDGTITTALEYWRAVSRPNLMIKVPATNEGIPAIEVLTAEGVNVNITLMFSMNHYEAVANAFIRGLALHPKPSTIASVASFFVSRVDTAVDKALATVGTPEALALRGKAAIANAKLAYRRYQEIFEGEAFAQLRAKGARPQRLLWGSTGAKNPAYRDVVYVEELIGPNTVNTMPVETANAFRDHGRLEPRLLSNIAEAQNTLNDLLRLGLDLNVVGEQLQNDGVKLFADAFDQLLSTLKQQCETK